MVAKHFNYRDGVTVMTPRASVTPKLSRRSADVMFGPSASFFSLLMKHVHFKPYHSNPAANRFCHIVVPAVNNN